MMKKSNPDFPNIPGRSNWGCGNEKAIELEDVLSEGLEFWFWNAQAAIDSAS